MSDAAKLIEGGRDLSIEALKAQEADRLASIEAKRRKQLARAFQGIGGKISRK